MDEISEWIKFVVVMLGMAVGYGYLKSSVASLKEQFKEHKEGVAKRFIRVEIKVDEAEKVLENLKATVDGIDKRTDRMDTKIDKLLERK